MGSSDFVGLTAEMTTVGVADTPKDGAAAMAASSLLRWERFLPKMVLRVLLVESDDSTRQIVTAILRKCNYKVAAVSDGLKAWEVLKRRPHSIDLILTEVELPSISGFALLTLIMEHEICKNIPVIMMSANDSVSTVYKCMLRGAADFLVKPVRKNELKNLWQHVWRRQVSTSGGSGPDEESDAQLQVEAIAENNATSNHSSGYVERNMERIERGSDAQSSCTKPNMEAEGTHMEQGKAKSLSNHMETQKFEEYNKTSKRSRTQKNETEGQKADTSGQEKDMVMDARWECVNDFFVDANLATPNPCREAIDLIGSFDNYPYRSSLNHGANEVDHPSPVLDLSLRRSHPVSQFGDDRHGLKQSDASAFSPYIHRTQPGCANQEKDYKTNSDKPLSKKGVGYSFDRLGSCQENMTSLQGKAESQSQLVYSVPIVRCENADVSYGPPMQSAGGHQEFQAKRCYMSNPETRSSSQEPEQTEKREGHNNVEKDHSASSSFCNGNGGFVNMSSKGSGSDGHFNLVSDGNNNSHRSTQREAALNKFRLKRKDRCYGKKVRYESRKKLAEQRPRVKGQFVRQVQTSNPSPMEAGTEECRN